MKANYVQFASPQFKVLSDKQILDLHFASLQILEKTGVAVYSDEAIELLDGAGADVSDSKRVKIPSYVIEHALRVSPKNVTLYTRDGQPKIFLNGSRTYFGGVVDLPDILDPYSGKRRFHYAEDTADMVRLIDHLPNIVWIMNSGLAHGLPPQLSEKVTQVHCLMNTNKPFAPAPINAAGLKDIFEVVQIVSGGMENLRRRPFLINSVEPSTPLIHSREALEMSLLCAEHGIPNIVFNMLMAGATSPATLAGTLAVANAELLSHLTIIQLKSPGAPVIYGGEPNIMDMRTSIFTYGAPELCLLSACLTELTHSYGLPMFGTAGTTDAKTIGAQAGIEIMHQVLTSALSGADLVHDVGLMDHCTMISPELVVMSDEAIEMIKVTMGGLEINDETLSLELIDQIGPGGNYLNEEHTLKWFRKFWVPSIMDRTQLTQELAQDSVRHCEDLLKEKTCKILETHRPQTLPEEMIKEIKTLEATWFRSAGQNYPYPSRPKFL